MAVNMCKVCEQTYATMHLGDVGVCRLCEIREMPWRRKIAAEIHALGGSAFLVEAVRQGSAYPNSRPTGGERGHPPVEY